MDCTWLLPIMLYLVPSFSVMTEHWPRIHKSKLQGKKSELQWACHNCFILMGWAFEGVMMKVSCMHWSWVVPFSILAWGAYRARVGSMLD